MTCIPNIIAELGIPDWRETTGYPQLRETSMSDWRWEFLRRNPQYRHDYQRPDTSLEDESRCRYFERVYAMVTPQDPRVSAAEYIKSYWARHQHDVLCFPIYHFDKFIGTNSLSTMYANAQEIERIMHQASFHDLFFRVDPLKPLEPQFKAITEISRMSQRSLLRKSPRPRRSKKKWLLYLRVLDARECEATYIEIARVCLPHQDEAAAIGAVRDLHKQASQLRDRWPFASELE
jgi:Family of unknown function (DUF6499)